MKTYKLDIQFLQQRAEFSRIPDIFCSQISSDQLLNFTIKDWNAALWY